MRFDRVGEFCYDFARFVNRCIYETGEHWVPGGESRRTVSGLERSSTKAFLSGAQDNLVVIGSMDRSGDWRSGDWRLRQV